MSRGVGDSGQGGGWPKWFLRGRSAVPGNGAKESLFRCFSEELKQRLGGRIVGQAEVRVDLVVGGLLGTEDRDGNARVFQHVPQTLRLRAGVWMLGDMQDQEGRNSFVLGHMRDRGEVTMF